METYNLVEIKVRIDDGKIFSAYEMQDANGKRMEWNVGGFTHPHFDKETALAVADCYNEFLIYDPKKDTFFERECGKTIDIISENYFGLYELGFNWVWEKVM